jgi:hypothetical protein
MDNNEREKSSFGKSHIQVLARINQTFACYGTLRSALVGLAYQGKDIVYGFIMEYSSLRDFGPY